MTFASQSAYYWSKVKLNIVPPCCFSTSESSHTCRDACCQREDLLPAMSGNNWRCSVVFTFIHEKWPEHLSLRILRILEVVHNMTENPVNFQNKSNKCRLPSRLSMANYTRQWTYLLWLPEHNVATGTSLSESWQKEAWGGTSSHFREQQQWW